MHMTENIEQIIGGAAREHYYGQMHYRDLQIIGAVVGFSSVEVSFNNLAGLVVTVQCIHGGDKIEFSA